MASRFRGRMDNTGPKKDRRNKGIGAAVRAAKRAEAESRARKTDPRKTRAFRLGSSYDPTTGKRRKWTPTDWRAHDERVEAFLNTLAAS